jgi:PhnB protein
MLVQPYLNFDGRCEEAIEFYQRAVGAEVQGLMRFKDNPGPASSEHVTPGTENKVMHAALKIGDSLVMASDGYCQGKPSFQGVSLALQVKDAAAADKAFNALAEGGQVTLPLTQTFWSPRFGMLVDRFGVAWMINVSTQ